MCAQRVFLSTTEPAALRTRYKKETKKNINVAFLLLGRGALVAYHLSTAAAMVTTPQRREPLFADRTLFAENER